MHTPQSELFITRGPGGEGPPQLGLTADLYLSSFLAEEEVPTDWTYLGLPKVPGLRFGQPYFLWQAPETLFGGWLACSRDSTSRRAAAVQHWGMGTWRMPHLYGCCKADLHGESAC